MKPILKAIMTIMFVVVIAGAGTWATFTDEAASNGNTFTAGNLDLKIKNSVDQAWFDQVAETWTLYNMKPGDISALGSVNLKQLGSLEGSHIDMSASYVSTHTPADDMAKNMTILIANYNNGGLTDLLTGYNGGVYYGEWEIKDVDSDGKKTLYDLAHSPILNLPAPSGINTDSFHMQVKFDPNAGNEFQGDILTLTVKFELVQ